MTNPSIVEGAPAGGGAQRPVVGFVTGRLAEFALNRTLGEMAPSLPFDCRVITLPIAVAALMTTDWIARQLEPPRGLARLVLPGYCSGDVERLRRALGIDIELGPRDLRELPQHLGGSARGADYGAFDIEILAEVNHVPQLSLQSVLELARKYRASGADVVDLGCDPGGPFTAIGDVVRALRAEGFRVSIDSLDPEEIVPAAAAGAELVLSVNSTNIEVARDLGCEVVVVPDDIATLGGLDESLDKLAAWGARFRIDPVIEPIGFGFARSLARYVTVRERYPKAEMLMGIGNLTELTDCDSAAANVLLIGFCQELGIRSVLTTEVIHWARTSVAECDIARRLVHHACEHRTLPKHLEPRLHLLRDATRRQHGFDVIDKLAREIKDRNFRIFVEQGEIHVLARGLHLRGVEAFALFEEMAVTDASHAFYLGYEMAKAVTALTLDKDYEQDRALRWGFLTREETSHVDRRRKREEGEGP